ncbi:MAG: NADH:ubiquinone reductase (Na(+)-transporting) subunit F [Candidatus Sumerlaeia bacterium]
MLTFIFAVLTFTAVVVGLSMLLNLAASKLQDYGTCQIDINDGEETLSVEGGATLLSVLTANKIFIPSACGGQGTCSYCKLRVLDGGGPILPTETPFMTRQELRDQVRLSCQVKVKQDLKIRIPEDYLKVQEYKAEVVHVKQLTVDIYECRFKLIEPETIDFRQSQYIQMKAPNPKGGEPIFRAYSMSNAESDDHALELIVRHIPNGICSTYLTQTIQPGDIVEFNGPFGEFTITEDPSVEIICVGGGSGMAPMKSIILSQLEKEPERPIQLFFGCRAVKDIFYMDMFEKLKEKHPNFDFVYALSALDEGDEWDGPTGFIHLHIDKRLDEGAKRQTFLCGPPMMVEAATNVLRTKGVKKRDIMYDDFGI